ncbi:uncharacterized protein [Nicotiana tomentosiformis]|uniref:uncharacterized protein n=1 Tax=Nicotiana tomentosiformis TaxID=4098 RepID=UPI00388CC43C
MNELEARLQQTEKDQMSHSQEAAQLHEDLKEAKAKWVEHHDVVIAVVEHETVIEEQVNNLKARLCSKTEDANAAEERRAKIEKRLKSVMEQNRLHSTTNIELDSKISMMKSENEELQSKIDKLQAKLWDQVDSFVFDKTYTMYHMKRKTLEEAK